LHCSVRDTGVGIAAEKLEAIFAPFEQADSSTTRRYGGTGLGLTIARQLVAMMRGELWVESTVDSGSTFHFTTRLGRGRGGAADRPTYASVPAPHRPLRVLLAEDNIVNQRLAVRLLEKAGHRVVIAENGLAACAAAAANTFDLVLMDVQMPDVDGFEATARIRAREQLAGGHVPIVAMTAHAMSGDRERCLAAGMDEYVSKPVRAESLFRVIDRLVAALPPIG